MLPHELDAALSITNACARYLSLKRIVVRPCPPLLDALKHHCQTAAKVAALTTPAGLAETILTFDTSPDVDTEHETTTDRSIFADRALTGEAGFAWHNGLGSNSAAPLATDDMLTAAVSL